MDEDSLEPEPEKLRFLVLPEGCKDLIDALRLRQQGEGSVKVPGRVIATPARNTALPMPLSVELPDPVAVCDLAAVLHQSVFQVIKALMEFDVLASLQTDIDFDTASRVCLHYGVAATRRPRDTVL